MRKASLKAAIQNVSRWGDTDVFPKPIENNAIGDRSADFLGLLEEFSRGINDQLAEDPPIVVAATPNGYAGFRWATQLDPLWNCYLLAATFNLAPQIEKRRLPSEYVTSHRLDLDLPDGRLFKEEGYANFVRRCSEESASFSHVVVTDIADFYGRVSHHRLENALEELPNVAGLHKKIIGVLGRISRGKSYGLPVGGPAARILAEVLLDRTDRLLLSRNIRFVRYADDYRLFARSEDEAHAHLAAVAELLAVNEGLSLQRAKTRVMTAAEFVATIAVPTSHGGKLSGKELSARQLLNFRLRFDPYSPTAEEDYANLEREIDKIDLVDLFSVELSKSRIDPQFTKKLLKAVQYASPTTKSAIAESLALNLPLLAPVLPQVLSSIKGLWADAQPVARGVVVEQIADAWNKSSYLLRPGVSRAFAVRLLGMDDSNQSEGVLAAIFADSNSDALVRRDVILAMARRRALWWLSDQLQRFRDLSSPWERRALLVSTPVMTEEAAHFVRKNRRGLSAMETFVLDWATSQRAADDAWRPPL